MTSQSSIAPESSGTSLVDTSDQHETECAAAAIVQEVLREPEYLHWTNIGV